MKKIIPVLILMLVAVAGVFAQSTEPIATNLKEVKAKIEYPVFARSQGIEGNVTVEFTVSPYGEIEKYTIKNACDEVLKQAIEKVIKDLEFIPSIDENGNTQTGKITIPFNFELEVS
jgi:TonB family protein